MMSISLVVIRMFFVALCILISLTYTFTQPLSDELITNACIGCLGGLTLGLGCIGLENALKRLNLEDFTLALLGLILGNFMGEAIWTILEPTLSNSLALSIPLSLAKATIFLVSIYFSLIALFHTAVKFSFSSLFRSKENAAVYSSDILMDPSVLMDPRVIDLAASGILDNQLVIPRFLLKDLYYLADHTDEQNKAKGRAALDIVKKLEATPNLNLRFIDTDFSDIEDVRTKLNRLATNLSAKILTAEMNRLQQTPDDIPIINMNFLSNALKPITQTGECLTIKIQRYGKEPRQGVGYLKDGTMVVVNGGAEFIGEEIKAYVLSVKHTASGRMIFCNAADDHVIPDVHTHTLADLEAKHKNYFSL
ncbi:MAG: hypothetical protein CK425_00835 [Parachlamydia sp.]|nr:MAG: hypothetical protein CK425_00835 [Parachlamydia sp.]